MPESARLLALCEGVSFLFTQRGGGVSAGPFGALNLSFDVGDDPLAVADNRGLVLRSIGPGPQGIGWMRQVHGTDVVYFSKSSSVAARPLDLAGRQPQADAAFTDSRRVAVAVLTADCAPVLMADPVAGLVGAAHAGRPGLVAGVVPALVVAMARAGADPGRMRAVIGPSICGGCYEVPAGLRDQVAAAAPGSACLTRAGTPGIDLRAGLRAQLVGLGLGQITDDLRCTAQCDELFSYRRDGTTGRFAGLIWLTP